MCCGSDWFMRFRLSERLNIGRPNAICRQYPYIHSYSSLFQFYSVVPCSKLARNYSAIISLPTPLLPHLHIGAEGGAIQKIAVSAKSTVYCLCACYPVQYLLHSDHRDSGTRTETGGDRFDPEKRNYSELGFALSTEITSLTSRTGQYCRKQR